MIFRRVKYKLFRSPHKRQTGPKNNITLAADKRKIQDNVEKKKEKK